MNGPRSNTLTLSGGRHLQRLPRYGLACLIYWLALAPPATANDAYPCDQEPNKVALVIGNETYAHLEDIPSAGEDARQIRDRLTDLGFHVTYVPDVPTRAVFQNQVLKEFRKTLEGGELVVFYFSGHGFSYRQNNYLAPTQMPLDINEAGVNAHAVSVESIEDLLSRESPGLLMFFIDACRSLGSFVVRNEQGESVLNKGLAEPLDLKLGVNSIISYATRHGKIAVGTGAPGQTSIFTRHLISHLSTEGKPFLEVFRRVAAEVRNHTNEEQVPYPYLFSQTDPYLKPTAEIVAQQKESWESVIDKEYDVVKVFYYMNSVSPCAASVRKWLEDNLSRATRFIGVSSVAAAVNQPAVSFANQRLDDALGHSPRYTRVSPIAVDRAWRPGSVGRVSVQRLGLPLFAFSRALTEEQAAALRETSDAEIGLLRSGTSPRPPEALAYSLGAIDTHEKVVATRRLSGLASPSAAAQTVESIPLGSQLLVNGVTVGADSQTYVSASTAYNAKSFFIRIPELVAALEPLELGQSVREIVVPPRPDGLPGLVAPEPIREAVEEMRRQGWKITWVSLAAAPADAEGERERELQRSHRLVMLMNAEHILKRAGIEGTRITSVAGREDFSGDGVRVRFFGIR